MASFLPTAAITLLLLVLSPSPSVAIVDGDGDILRNGGYYYILPHSSSKGGLTLTPAKDSSLCPLFITQDSSNSRGLPVKISTVYRIPYLSSGFPIDFSFDKVTTCYKSPHWWVAPSDANNKSYVLVGASGPFKPTYYYNIVEAKTGKNVYNIKFCHTSESEIKCKDVSILDDGMLGVIEDSPFPVTFEKYSPNIASYV
ncbi:trypsin inhibitor BvTI-like [Chenopodium quinoa]|uniref:trypsin inhibitor BvTI-like n=1 Tax=Chenopodium quinoa TaxID=63459 RepID=UPI000B7762DD|nr:trypsin inhibitor BvTI-like [Chenopodium quinoa]